MADPKKRKYDDEMLVPGAGPTRSIERYEPIAWPAWLQSRKPLPPYPADDDAWLQSRKPLPYAGLNEDDEAIMGIGAGAGFQGRESMPYAESDWKMPWEASEISTALDDPGNIFGKYLEPGITYWPAGMHPDEVLARKKSGAPDMPDIWSRNNMGRASGDIRNPSIVTAPPPVGPIHDMHKLRSATAGRDKGSVTDGSYIWKIGHYDEPPMPPIHMTSPRGGPLQPTRRQEGAPYGTQTRPMSAHSDVFRDLDAAMTYPIGSYAPMGSAHSMTTPDVDLACKLKQVEQNMLLRMEESQKAQEHDLEIIRKKMAEMEKE